MVRGQRTFHEFSLFLGALLLSERLEEAVVPQAGRVRQTLDDCVQETLAPGDNGQGLAIFFLGHVRLNKELGKTQVELSCFRNLLCFLHS